MTRGRAAPRQRGRLRVAALLVTGATLALAGEARTAVPPTLVCKPAPGTDKLPPTARHGLIDHLVQYPVVRLATRAQRAEAKRIHDELVASANSQNWRNVAAARRLGYRTGQRTALEPGEPTRFFHAERPQERRRGPLLDVTRPKALIYANVPDHPLVLVGAMWSTLDGERGPTPAGPIMRWHSHVVCKKTGERGLKPPAGGRCPPGTRLQQGESEMLHVWFTGALRSAFAIRAPQPELCAQRLIPRRSCIR